MKRILHICTVFLALVVFVQSLVFSSSAVTGKVGLSAPSIIQPNETFKAVVNVSGDKVYGVNGSVTYSSNLKLVKTEKAIAGDWKTELNTVENTVYFASADQKQNTPISKKTDVVVLTFTANGNIGESIEIKVKDAVASDIEGFTKLSDAKFSLTLGEEDSAIDNENDNSTDFSDDYFDDVSDEADQEGNSNNNLLKSLVVKNAEITPEFDPEVKNYNTTVPFSVKELEVEAIAQDENATVTIGDTVLEYVGNNIIRIEVVSESGLKRTYKIYATREDKIKNAAGGNEGLSLLWIILICVGAALILAAIVFVVILLIKKRKKKIS